MKIKAGPRMLNAKYALTIKNDSGFDPCHEQLLNIVKGDENNRAMALKTIQSHGAEANMVNNYCQAIDQVNALR